MTTKFYVIETPKAMYVHKTMGSAEMQQKAFKIDFGVDVKIKTVTTPTIQEWLEEQNHKPINLRGEA